MIISHHLGLVSFQIQFGNPQNVVICMLDGLSGRVHGSQNQLFLILFEGLSAINKVPKLTSVVNICKIPKRQAYYWKPFLGIS